MTTDHTCPQCHAKLPSDAPAGLCPRCLIRSAAGLTEPVPNAEFPDIGDAADVARRLPQFEIIELLGKGGMGVVYKARQPALDRLVALKILPPEDALSPDFVERFRREARALAKLNHPNIVTIHECGEQGGLYFFAMEYVDGANLRQLFEAGNLTPAEALAIVPKICDALEYAHEEGVIHRDIKPENLLLDKKGRVKIADFGLAKLLRREPLDMTLTLSGTALGTMRYMAPEQMEKPETVDHRADIYSLGVVIYEMLTGEVPVGRFELPSQKAHVDVRLDEVVLRSLERDVERRYQHASEVKAGVENVTAKPQTAATAIAAAAKPARRHFLNALLTLLWFATFIFGINFRATSNAIDGGRASKVTIGSIDPLFVHEGKPSGFYQAFYPFSWSFFSLMVSVVIFLALLRISREDEGKAPRDPAWWRDWWKQVGIWLGLLFIACAIRTAMNPGAIFQPKDLPVSATATPAPK